MPCPAAHALQARGAAGPRGTPGSQASHAHLDDGLWGRPHRSSSKVPAMCTRHARSRCAHGTGICVLRVGLASAGLSGVEHPAPPTRPLASQTRRPRRPGTQARCTFGARKQTRCACSSCGNCQRGWEGGLAWAGARRDWDPLPPHGSLGGSIAGCPAAAGNAGAARPPRPCISANPGPVQESNSEHTAFHIVTGSHPGLEKLVCAAMVALGGRPLASATCGSRHVGGLPSLRCRAGRPRGLGAEPIPR